MYESGIEIPFMSNNEGELAVYFSRGTAKRARSILEKYLPTFGSVQSLKIESETSISCEFFDVRDSASAVLTLNGQLIDNMVFYVSFKETDAMFAKPPSPTGSDDDKSPVSESASFSSENHREGLSVHAPVFESKRSNMMSLLSIPPGSTERNGGVHDSYSEPQSPADFYYEGRVEDLSSVGKPLTRHESYDYGKSKNSLDNYSQLDYFGAGKHTRRLSTSIPRSPRSDPMWDAEASLTFQVESYPDIMSRGYSVYTNATVPKNNVVDLERIARGLDTRTTLMLRNIPNKVDQQMLKEYIDVTNKNTYDFLYLRIDFLNKCNVGYAFISFTSPEAIITFAKARAGTKWNRFNSEKICDISYANIYGKECLIEKFRNSSVMDQDSAYRPKIYYSDGPSKGQEEEFPPPNNMNRKLRSLASIQQIGKPYFQLTVSRNMLTVPFRSLSSW
ncbi:RNA recognition motif 2-domain-containing protein [Lipomyces tetrasporus]